MLRQRNLDQLSLPGELKYPVHVLEKNHLEELSKRFFNLLRKGSLLVIFINIIPKKSPVHPRTPPVPFFHYGNADNNK